MYNLENNLYIERHVWEGSSVLKKRINPFSYEENSQNKRACEMLVDSSWPSFFYTDVSTFQEEKEEILNTSTPILQEVNYDSVICPLDPLPFPVMSTSLKSKKITQIKYSYDEIKYLQNMKNIVNSKLIKLFCDKFKREINTMAFYRLKITCVYNPFVIDGRGGWRHLVNHQFGPKIDYDEDLLTSFVKRKFTHEAAYKEYCSLHPNSVNFQAFTKKFSIKKGELRKR